MDRLWAPWRIKYIKIKKRKGCIFCESIKSKNKNQDYVVLEGRHSFSMLNIFPYNNGHVMISPIRHIRELSQLNEEEILDIFTTLNTTKRMLDMVLKPHGYNIGINESKSAGAGEPGHLHIHMVPRWKADVNFMSTLYDTKVMSQSLDELYKHLKSSQRRIAKSL